MKALQTIIVDDEPLARQRLRNLIKEDEELRILEECENGYEAVNVLKQSTPDILFLDIQMPEINGFEVLNQIEYLKIPAIIFVTAYNEYAIRAFEVHALDYLLKPFDKHRFVIAVERAKLHVRSLYSGQSERRLQSLVNEMNMKEKLPISKRIMIKTSGRVYFIEFDEIDWIEADGNYVKIHTGEKSHMIRETMNHLEQKLDASKFSRIHRSAIVNIDKIKELQPWFHGDYTILLYSGKKLTMSRNYKELLQRY